jgi:rRNA maturation RNase YbeY
MGIFFNSVDVNSPEIDFKSFEKIIKSRIKVHGYRLGEINFVFCSDDYLLEINRKFLHHDYFTDVITFDYSENNIFSADIYLSLDRVEENATLFLTNSSQELVRVMAHGILHVLGFSDKEELDIIKMRTMENEILEQFNSFKK